MVRGNWQKRVETAQARKDATKQRKQRRNEKENSKNQLNQFLSDFDKAIVDISKFDKKILHVWTEVCPKKLQGDASRYLAKIAASAPSNSYKSGRNENHQGKKHPRTKGSQSSSANTDDHSTEENTNQCCRNHFFYGSCNGSIGKKAKGIKKSCRLMHFQKDPCLTLADVVLRISKKNTTNDNNALSSNVDEDLSSILTASADAIIANYSHLSSNSRSTTSKDQIGMPMVYHLPISFHKNDLKSLLEHSSEENFTSISQVITTTLSQQKCSLSHVCYLAIDGHLLYDKFNGGSLYSNSFENFQTILVESSSSSRSRSNSIATNLDPLDSSQAIEESSNHYDSNEKQGGLILKLPAIILDYITTFLPDVYAAYLPQVCKHWRMEVGTTSPYLWNQLLLRNGWDIPIVETNQSIATATSVSSLHVLMASPTPSMPMSPSFMSPVAISQLGSPPLKSPSQFISPLQSPTSFASPPLQQSHGTVPSHHNNIYGIGIDPSYLNLSQLNRHTFLSHYQTCRDIKALTSSIRQLVDRKSSQAINTGIKMSKNQSTNHIKSYMTATQSFKASRDSPDAPNDCVSLRMFDDTRVLGAYRLDGTLRLFEASATPITTTSNSAAKLSCRQLVCVKAVPKTVKKNQFRLVSMDIDDSNVGCLCEVYHMKNYALSEDVEDNDDNVHTNGIVSKIETLLTIVSREDLLCAAGGRGFELDNEDSLVIVNIQEVVLDFLQDMETNFQQAYYEHDDDTLSFDRNDIKVKVSGNVVACREGQFCMEVSISRHLNAPYSAREPIPLVVDHKVCVFSKSADKIIWMQDVSNNLWPNRFSPVYTLASSTASNWSSNGTQRRRQPTSVALVSNVSPHIYLLRVHRRGQADQAKLVKHSDIGRVEIESEGWRILTVSPRKIVVLASNIVVAGDTFEREGRFGLRFKSVLYFYPIDAESDEGNEADAIPFSLTLEGSCRIIRIQPIGETYILVVCSHKRGMEENVDYGGQWFEPDGTEEQTEVIEARVIHVPSNKEIDCIELMPGKYWNNDQDTFPFLFTGSMRSFAMGMSWYGMVITGSSVRDAFISALKKASALIEDENKHGKKKRTPRTKIAMHRNKNKKDGFARGMRSM